jgi:hypothetical protein
MVTPPAILLEWCVPKKDAEASTGLNSLVVKYVFRFTISLTTERKNLFKGSVSHVCYNCFKKTFSNPHGSVMQCTSWVHLDLGVVCRERAIIVVTVGAT